ncbi:MAG: hypothetical protein KF773_22185 [Deltaproteobacteria bacterium]|nr:hypothetical protein [Deltaproteobacteria bacterium]
MHTHQLLATTTSQEGHVVTLRCAGSAETEALPQLRGVLDALHERAVAGAASEVVADVRDLEFASSSCLKAFVGWLQRVIELDEPARYQVRFRSNPRHSWQRRSLGALAAFAGDLVRIETEAA